MFKDFGYVDNQFINLYSVDNPIMEQGEICYFLFHSIHDYFMPIMGKGKIISDKFSDGMNKIYHVQLLSIEENMDFISTWFNDKTYHMTPLIKENVSSHSLKQLKLHHNINSKFFIDNLFKVESFFIRNSFEKIQQLKKEYISIMLEDLKSNIKDMENVLGIIESTK